MTRRRFIGTAAATAGVVAAVGSAAPDVALASAPAQARITGKLQVVQKLDFHPDHNAFVQKTIRDYAAQQRWDLDLSDLAGFIGSSDIYQKFQAQKAAGQPVDLVFNDALAARLLQLYDLIRDAKPLVDRAVQRYGKIFGSGRVALNIEGDKWYGLPFHGRVDGHWVRIDKFAEVGLTIDNGDFATWDQVLNACRAVSKPDQNLFGWGMTVNRSGDGEGLVQNVMWQWGGALADVSGQIVTLFSPETIDAMTWLSDVYLNPANQAMLPPGVNSWNDTGNNDAWLAGTLAYTQNAGTLYAKSVVDKTTLPDGSGTLLSDVTGVVPYPYGPYGQRLQGSSGMHFHFMNGSKNYDAAAQLAEYLLTDDVQTPLYQISAGYVVPSYEGMWRNPTIQSNRVAQVYQPVMFNEPPFQGLAYRGPLSAAADAVNQQNVMTDMMGEILAGKPVVAAVRDAHLRAVDIYQSFGLKGR